MSTFGPVRSCDGDGIMASAAAQALQMTGYIIFYLYPDVIRVVSGFSY